MQLTVLTYNTLFAGRDGNDDRRAQAQIELINECKSDVFLMQEAKGFDANGGAWLYALEARIGMRGFLALAPARGRIPPSSFVNRCGQLPLPLTGRTFITPLPPSRLPWRAATGRSPS